MQRQERNRIHCGRQRGGPGYVYYSDEGVGVRQYFADPAKGNAELVLFATTGFTEAHEGISIYETGLRTGYLLVSDQGADQFRIFCPESTTAQPYSHPLLKVVRVAAQVSDGSDLTNAALLGFPHGLLVAMSTDRTFHYYRWEGLAGKDLTAVSGATARMPLLLARPNGE